MAACEGEDIGPAISFTASSRRSVRLNTQVEVASDAEESADDLTDEAVAAARWDSKELWQGPGAGYLGNACEEEKGKNFADLLSAVAAEYAKLVVTTRELERQNKRLSQQHRLPDGGGQEPLDGGARPEEGDGEEKDSKEDAGEAFMFEVRKVFSGQAPALSVQPSPSDAIKRLSRQHQSMQSMDYSGSVFAPRDSRQSCIRRQSSRESIRLGSSLVANRSSLNSSVKRASTFDPETLENAGFGNKRPKWVEAVWMLFVDPEYHPVARIYHQSMNPLIVASVLFIMAQFINLPALSGVAVAVVEVAFDAIFCIDILMRFAFCPDHLAFLRSMFNWIDLWAIPALVLRACVGFVLPTREEDELLFIYTQIFFLGANPVLRLLKLLRRFDKCLLVFRALEDAFEALPVLLYMLLLIWVSGASLVHFLEPETIESIPDALWFVIVTMTTVGYGDVTPTTQAGRVATGVLILVSMMYTAIPIGIIGNSFNRVWEDRNNFLVAQRMTFRLLQWGYEAADMPRLFKLFDPHCNGELNYKEFKRMMLQMNIGLKEHDVAEIFETFDRDGSGAVDDREFVRAIFPQSYHKVYDDCEEDEDLPENDIPLQQRLSGATHSEASYRDSSKTSSVSGAVARRPSTGTAAGVGSEASAESADDDNTSEGHGCGGAAMRLSDSRLAQRPTKQELGEPSC